jgi:hypothetical protein
LVRNNDASKRCCDRRYHRSWMGSWPGSRALSPVRPRRRLPAPARRPGTSASRTCQRPRATEASRIGWSAMTATIRCEQQRSPNALTSAQPARLSGRNFGASSLSFARQVLGVSLCRSFPGDVNAGVAAAMSPLHPCLAAVAHPQHRVARPCRALAAREATPRFRATRKFRAASPGDAGVQSCVARRRGSPELRRQATRESRAASPGDAGVQSCVARRGGAHNPPGARTTRPPFMY